ncbi:lytic transglycosylase domain-containing protein [Amaricoccus macauensis]|uniref:lytic transglycosylase domain-containing protein n=1 Tax=Amaricoccus macauensis TaxID=57001 RepID=UPI003C7E3ED6
MIAFLSAAPSLAEGAADDERNAQLCERAIVNGARRGGVPPEVLYAISLTETGRMTGGRLRPWPWAINREGKGHWFKNREEAVAFGKQSLADGRKSFDVGCVQINYRWHGHAFPSLDDMFDPEWTATYAAQFLRTLYEERGNWSEAAGAYHSLTPQYSSIYRKRFDRILAGIDSTFLLESANTRFAAGAPSSGRVGPPRAGTRMTLEQRQETARATFEERRRALGPPPEPAPGGIAGTIFLPATGSLLNEGRSSLLTEGKPLLTAPRGSLY